MPVFRVTPANAAPFLRYAGSRAAAERRALRELWPLAVRSVALLSPSELARLAADGYPLPVAARATVKTFKELQATQASKARERARREAIREAAQVAKAQALEEAREAKRVQKEEEREARRKERERAKRAAAKAARATQAAAKEAAAVAPMVSLSGPPGGDSPDNVAPWD